jgi:hypothetical protein
MRFYALRRQLPRLISSPPASVIPGLLNFFERHQVGGFQQAAKIFLADVMVAAKGKNTVAQRCCQ